ncbi:globin family protein [Comamonas sp. J-3]|uniref:globin family protein n=1 Tax=Comamonas trifloxystrobinivorans TaxID=3350256 RepID=UPI00372A5AD5
MTPEAIDLVQSSFAKVKPVAPQAGALFYKNLFNLAPELRPLFKADVSDQGRKLMDMLAIAVGMLRQPQRLNDAVMQLGRRHAAYGVKQEHFRPVGEALLMTLEQGLGDAFTPQVRLAWQSLYKELTEVMGESLREENERKQVAQLRAQMERKKRALPWWKRLFRWG